MNNPGIPESSGLARVVAVFREQQNAKNLRNIDRLPIVQARRRAYLENRSEQAGLSISLPLECYTPEEFEALK